MFLMSKHVPAVGGIRPLQLFKKPKDEQYSTTNHGENQLGNKQLLN
uniref:Uncharacterized protein n=1 Tax=Arundo donax TaxID=35708 RepID=A0A0A9GDU2_ARUDO